MCWHRFDNNQGYNQQPQPPQLPHPPQFRPQQYNQAQNYATQNFAPQYVPQYAPPPPSQFTANLTHYGPPQPQYVPQYAPTSQFSGYPFQQQAPQAYFAGPSTNVPQPWFPDSGASHHVTANPKMLGNKVDIDGASTIYMGNGQGISIKSIGSSTFTSPMQPHTLLTLKNLLLVPNITKNLLSVSQFARDNKVFFEFHPYHCVVKSQETKAILLKGTLGTDGLYRFNDLHLNSAQQPGSTSLISEFSSAPSTSSINNVAATNSQNSTALSSYNIWHCRLGHPNQVILRKVMTICDIPLLNKSYTDFCTACCMGKLHRLHSQPSVTVYDKPLELIFTDLWGPAPMESSTG